MGISHEKKFSLRSKLKLNLQQLDFNCLFTTSAEATEFVQKAYVNDVVSCDLPSKTTYEPVLGVI